MCKMYFKKPQIIGKVIKQINIPDTNKNQCNTCIYDLYVFIVHCAQNQTGKHVSIIYNGKKLIEVSIDNNLPSCKACGTHIGTSIDKFIHTYSFINMDHEMYCHVSINILSNDVFVYLFKNRQIITLIES